MALVQFILIVLAPIVLVAAVAAGMWIPAHEAARAIQRDNPVPPRYRLKIFLNMLIAGLPFLVLPLLLIIQRFPRAPAEGAEAGAYWALLLVAVGYAVQGLSQALLGSALLPHLAAHPREIMRGFGAQLVPLPLTLIAFLSAFLWIGRSQYASPEGPYGPEPWRAILFMVTCAFMVAASVMAGREITEKKEPDWKRVMRPLLAALAFGAVGAVVLVQPLF